MLDVVDGHPAVVAARGLLPVLRDNRPVVDAAAPMAPEVRAALGEAGMFRLAAPTEVGGLEVSMAVMAAVLETLAAADPGAAWHLANSPMAGLVAASLDVSTREKVFADPTWCYSYSAVPAAWRDRSPEVTS
jgi:alkylation response protein AidB-like acyl-CoA dehydrogenase